MEEKEFDYINVIPLVDVMLVLLTIVLTTATFVATGGLPLDLPKSCSRNEEVNQRQTLEMDKSGRLYLNAHPISIYDLRKAIRPLNKVTPFLIRADKDIALQLCVDVLDVIKGEGFKRVNLQTEKKARSLGA